ncbi:MAG: ornithine cyclodeaminase family protein [Solirubrobacteraceae bacterium]
MRVLILSDADVHAALDRDACERAMAAVLVQRAHGRADNPLRTVSAPAGAAGFMGLMPAYVSGDGAPAPDAAFGLKAICLMPGNPRLGLDTHQGTVTLFDGDTGIPSAILNAAAITEIRTAAVTALATRELARGDAAVLGILGAGVQARSHLHALAGVRPWSEIRIYAPTAAQARAAASDVVAAGAQVPEPRVAATAREALDGADVVVTVTSSREPVLEHAWLAAGAHVNAIGASGLSAQELPVATVAAAALFCDSRESLQAEAADYQSAVREGAIAGPEHVRAELGEVLAGLRPGRRGPEELTMFRSLGIGVEDLAAARAAVAAARELGLGVEVEL